MGESRYIVFNEKVETVGRIGEYFHSYNLKVGDVVSWVRHESENFNCGVGVIVRNKSGEPRIMGWYNSPLEEFLSVRKIIDAKLLTIEKLKKINDNLCIEEFEDITLEEAEKLLGKKIVI